MSKVFFDNFYQISQRLASCKQIKKPHLLIISDTYSFNSKGKVNYKTQGLMAEQCGVSIRTINSVISDLKKWEIINVTESRFKESLKMVVNRDKLEEFICKNESQIVKKSFEESSKEDDSLLSSSGWGARDTQNLRSGYAKIAEPVRKTCVQQDQVQEQLQDQHRHTDKETEKIVSSATDENSKSLFVDQIEDYIYPMCYEAMEVIKWYKDEHNVRVYDGSLTVEEWEDCERTMSIVDFDASMYFHHMIVERGIESFKKAPSLTDLLLVNSSVCFESFYSAIEC